MSLKKNISASYASQAYSSLLGILILPVYLRLMGAEAYGLIGFFTLLQAWFNLLDFGLSGTLSRETARFRGGVLDALDLRRLLRVMEVAFLIIGISGALAIWLGSYYLVEDWLKLDTLDPGEVNQSIQIMAAILVLRWAGGLSRGIITGFENLVWLGGFGATIATLRFVIVIPVMLYFGTTPIVFFYYQLLVAVIEFAVLAFKAYALLPAGEKPTLDAMDWQAMVPTLRFTMGISFLSVAWIVMSQTDKLLLSRMLSLSDYGHFTLAALAASAIMLASGPISTALLPRLSRLHAEHKTVARDALYRTATRLVAAVVFPIAMTMALFAQPILLAWTGDPVLAHETQSVLSLYSLGNAFLVMAAFPYYLQYAHGTLRLHVYGSLLFLAFLIPALIWLTGTHGMTGAGVAWLAVNVAYLLAWVPVVHRRLLHKQHLDWLIRDVLRPAIISLLVLAPLAVFLPPAESRLLLALQTAIYLGLSLIACCRPAIRDWKSLSEALPEAQKRL